MKYKINGVEYGVGSEYSVAYPNDIMDGVIVDFPDNYLFLSDHVQEHRDIQDNIEQLEHFDMARCEIDYDIEPHKWVLDSITKAIIYTAEQSCIKACE